MKSKNKDVVVYSTNFPQNIPKEPFCMVSWSDYIEVIKENTNLKEQVKDMKIMSKID